MRREVNKRATFFVRNPSAGRGHLDNAQSLRDALKPNNPGSKTLVQSIVRAGNRIPGTKPYWQNQRYGLISMCHKEKCPAIFITASAADLWWESLAECMPRYEDWLAADDNGKRKIAEENLREYPHIAAHHFYVRWKAFFEVYLKPRLGIKYWWWRFKWQGRGSTHVHGLYWLDGVDIAPLKGFLSGKEKAEFERFWGVQVNA